jgi:hypothetical protein
VQCLNLDVDLRPEMANVADRLQFLLKWSHVVPPSLNDSI